MFENILQGILACLTPVNLLAILISVPLGIVVGCLPGFGAATGLVLVLPMTYGLDPGTAFIALTGIYVGAEYGGSISSILINTPGTAAAVMTGLDGHPLARQGKARDALLVSNIASFSGGIIGGLTMLFCMPVLGRFVLEFGAGEIFLLAAAGLLLVGSVTKGSRVKGILSVCFGLFFTFFGADALTGFSRFDFGSPILVGGLPLIAGLLALFAVPQMLEIALAGSCPGASLQAAPAEGESNFGLFRRYLGLLYRTMPRLIVRSGLIGVLVGIIPGVGASVASMAAYSAARRRSRHPEAFGTGSLEGVAAPETANNALVGGSLIPVLALGIPGSAAAAIYMGAIFLHGMTPGPDFLTKEANLVYLLIMAVFFCSFAQLLLGALSIGSFAKVLRVPVPRLFPVVVVLCCIGAYAIRSLDFDIVFFLGLGLFAYLLNILGFNMSAVVLGAFLAPTMESALMEALNIAPSKGGLLPYIASRHIAVVMLALLGLYLIWIFVGSLRRSRACASAGEPARTEEGECLPGSWRGERGTDFILYCVILAVSAFFLYLSLDYPLKSRLFPHVVLAIAAVCCVFGLFRCVRFGNSYAGRDLFPLARVPWRKFGQLGALLALYAACITWLGFYVPTFAFLFAAQPLTRGGLGSPGRVGRDVLFALIATLVVQVLFTHLFRMEMPGLPWLE